VGIQEPRLGSSDRARLSRGAEVRGRLGVEGRRGRGCGLQRRLDGDPCQRRSYGQGQGGGWRRQEVGNRRRQEVASACPKLVASVVVSVSEGIGDEVA
jgi:hypothetical protein